MNGVVKMNMKKCFTPFLIIAAMLLSAIPVSAEMVEPMTERVPGGTITAEIIIPGFDDPYLELRNAVEELFVYIRRAVNLLGREYDSDIPDEGWTHRDASPSRPLPPIQPSETPAIGTPWDGNVYEPDHIPFEYFFIASSPSPTPPPGRDEWWYTNEDDRDDFEDAILAAWDVYDLHAPVPTPPPGPELTTGDEFQVALRMSGNTGFAAISFRVDLPVGITLDMLEVPDTGLRVDSDWDLYGYVVNSGFSRLGMDGLTAISTEITGLFYISIVRDVNFTGFNTNEPEDLMLLHFHVNANASFPTGQTGPIEISFAHAMPTDDPDVPVTPAYPIAFNTGDPCGIGRWCGDVVNGSVIRCRLCYYNRLSINLRNVPSPVFGTGTIADTTDLPNETVNVGQIPLRVSPAP